ncbi:MAG: TerB family tellurite resistance protein [Pseudomonadota bacterium]
MLDRLFKLLEGEAEPQTLPEEEAREAVAALLVAAARADGSYDGDERALIDRILTARFALSPWQAGALREAGEAAEASSTGLHRFTLAVKRSVPLEQRVEIIEAVLEVAYADGDRSAEEASLVRQLVGLLHIPDREAGFARQRVADRLGLS